MKLCGTFVTKVFHYLHFPNETSDPGNLAVFEYVISSLCQPQLSPIVCLFISSMGNIRMAFKYESDKFLTVRKAALTTSKIMKYIKWAKSDCKKEKHNCIGCVYCINYLCPQYVPSQEFLVQVVVVFMRIYYLYINNTKQSYSTGFSVRCKICAGPQKTTNK